VRRDVVAATQDCQVIGALRGFTSC
jgi:hypothetical protein